jgi:hypothetical protein
MSVAVHVLMLAVVLTLMMQTAATKKKERMVKR